MGIPATDWQHDGFYQGANLFIQDRFEIPNASAKWEIVERALQHSIKGESSDRLHLHFASGYTKNWPITSAGLHTAVTVAWFLISSLLI